MVKYAAAIDKSIQLEKKHGKQKWEDLKKILKQNGYPVQFEDKNNLNLKLDNDNFIELFFLKNTNPGKFVHIQLWGHKFNVDQLNKKHYERPTNQHATLNSAVSYINAIYQDIKLETP